MSTTMAGHVLVIGVDGVRFDMLGPGTTPGIWGLGQSGFLAPVPVDDETPTWSGPCWATIVSGAVVTDLATAIVTEEGLRLSFVYLGAVDFAGHIAGTGAVYRARLRPPTGASAGC